jgi:hypothetical protein
MTHQNRLGPCRTGGFLSALALLTLPLHAATLTITKSGPEPAEIATGEQFDYDLSYQCVGAGAGDSCEHAVIADQMPADVEILECFGFADHQQDGGISCPSGLGRTATFHFSQEGEPANQPGTLAAGSQGTLKIQAWFPEGTTANGISADNMATFSSTSAEPQSVNSNVVTVISQAADLLTFSKTTWHWTGDTAKGADRVYRIEACQPAGARIGGLNAENLIISDVIPDGAGFVYASDGGTFVAGSGDDPDRVVWPGTTLAVDADGQAACLTRYVTLSYPSDFAFDEVTNTAQATYTPVGETAKTISDADTHGFVPAVPGAALDKYDAFTVNGEYPIETQPGFSWLLVPNNLGSVGLTNMVVTDPIPPQLKVNQIWVGDYAPNMSVNVQYQRESDVAAQAWNDLPGNPYTQWAYIDKNALNPPVSDDDRIVAIRWLYGDVPPGFMRVTHQSRFRATIQNPDRDGQPVNNGDVITNTATLTADNLPIPVEMTDSMIAVDELPVRPMVDKAPDINQPPYPDLTPGTGFLYVLSVRNMSTTSTDLVRPVLLDILPPQLAYVNHDFIFSDSNNPWWSDEVTDAVFDQYPNPGGDGTILRFAWPDMALPQYQTAYVVVTVRALGGAAGTPGQYINLAAGAGYGNPNVSNVVCRQTMADTDDLDQDGDSTETLCVSRNAPFNILATAGLDSVKEVRAGCVGSDDYGASAQSFANGPVDYQLTVSNPGNVAVTSALFYDIFPFVGDTGVIDIAVARNSEWSPVLTGAVAVPSGATVQYSTETNPCRPELFGGIGEDALPAGCTEDAWSGNLPTDITAVRALRIDFADITIEPEDALTFSWPMRIPVSAAIGDLGNNSFGYTASRIDGGTPALGAAEPNLVQTHIACVEEPPYIGDLVWADTDADGIQDPGESGLNGVVVEAFDTEDRGLAASTVTAPDGTGRDGFYRFGDLPAGGYTLRFTPPAGYAISPQYAGTDTAQDSDADQITGFTQAVTLVSGDERLDLDAGLFPSSTASIGDYVWIDRNGNDLQDESPADGLNGVPVRLLDAVGTEVAGTVTADDGFGNPGHYLFRDVPAGLYSIEVDRGQTFADGFVVADQGDGTNDSRILTDGGGVGEGAPFTVAAGDVVLSQDAGLVFPAGTLGLGDRVWMDADNDGIYEPGVGDEDGVDGVAVELYEDTDASNDYTPGTDRFVAVTTTFTKAGLPGYYQFTGLPAGAYLIRIPADSFSGHGALAGTIPSSGAAVIDPDEGNVDDDADQNAYVDDNGNRVTLALTLATGTEPDGDDNPTLDLGFVPLASLVAIGNRVFIDEDDDGTFDTGESGLDGVTVELYADGDDPSLQLPLASTTTANGGSWWLDRLDPGRYFVHVPPHVFSSGQPLDACRSSGGSGSDDADDDNADENGIDAGMPLTHGVSSTVVDLAVGDEPQGEPSETDYPGALPDANVNGTLDMGFTRDTVITCVEICDMDGDGGVSTGDLREIMLRRGQVVDPPGEAQSGDCLADGVITFNDAATCRAYQ